MSTPVQYSRPTADPVLGRVAAVCELVGFSKSHVLALARAGRFPQPVKLGDRCTVWRLDEVRGWIEEQTAQARSKALTS